MDLRGKSGLLIDDIPEMRSTIRIQLADAGLEDCDLARNIKEAMDKLAGKRYDLIVCDYNLGQGADGQQFLELARRKETLPRSTAFLMVTGESAYEQVAMAAEYAPDDYLLKPFTSETLRTRLERILDKKAALAPIYRHLGARGERKAALAACEEMLAAHGRYVIDVQRIKGELLLAAERSAEALALYEEVLRLRSTPWAEVGRARALVAAGRDEEATAGLQRALTAYPNYLAAYDTLAGMLEKTDKEAAQQVVEQALKVAPSTQRNRRVGALALENHDYRRAEEAFRRTVERDRTGFFKSHDDYAGLAKSCAEQGKTIDALHAVKEMAQHFQRSPELAARQAAVEAQVQAKAGNSQAAQAALERALAAMQGNELDAATTLEVAQACFAGGRADAARNIVRAVAEDYDENDQVLAQAQAVFAAAGFAGEGAALLAATHKRMVRLNNDAVGLAKSGAIEPAIGMLQEAADRLHNNCQIALNAALALLMHMHLNGLDARRLAQAERYLRQARRADPDHAKLDEVEAFFRQVAARGIERGA